MTEKKNLIIRRAHISDLAEMQQLFVDTISTICSPNYSADQQQAWSSSIQNKDRWERLITRQYSIVAILDHTIVGIAALDHGDYLDYLYVHKDYQRQGIANQLFDTLKLESLRQGYYKLSSDVSITALPFFESKGFKVIKENKVTIQEIELVNYRMQEV